MLLRAKRLACQTWLLLYLLQGHPPLIVAHMLLLKMELYKNCSQTSVHYLTILYLY